MGGSEGEEDGKMRRRVERLLPLAIALVGKRTIILVTSSPLTFTRPLVHCKSATLEAGAFEGWGGGGLAQGLWWGVGVLENRFGRPDLVSPL